MLRSIGAVVLGYVVMAGFVMLTFTAAYLAMGTERAFQPRSYEVSALWLGLSLPLGLVGAVLGGLVCAAVAKNDRAPLWLAGIVLVLGLALAVPVFLDKSEPKPRQGDVPNFQAMQNAKQPLWVALANPVIGALGALAGSRLRRVDPTVGHTIRQSLNS